MTDLNKIITTKPVTTTKLNPNNNNQNIISLTNADVKEFLIDSEKTESITKEILDVSLVIGIIKAEKIRLNLLEKIGIDGKTIGRGQVSQDAYDTVLKNFKPQIKDFCNKYQITFEEKYSDVIKNERYEELVIMAYLALKINSSIKIEPGTNTTKRTKIDIIKFAIGVYHGGFNSLSTTQIEMNELNSYQPIAIRLLTKGTRKQKDLISYIEEVYSEYKRTMPVIIDLPPIIVTPPLKTQPLEAKNIEIIQPNYLIKEGDTLYDIVEALNKIDPTISIETIQKANPKINPERLQIDSSINIPGFSFKEIELKAGETISEHCPAEQLEAILQLNKIKAPNKLPIGFKFYIPQAIK